MLLSALHALGQLGDTLKVAQTILALLPKSGVMVIDTDRRNGSARASTTPRSR